MSGLDLNVMSCALFLYSEFQGSKAWGKGDEK